MRGGVVAGSAPKSGSRSRILASTRATESPGNGGVPVSISYSTHPNAQMSLRWSTRGACCLLGAHVRRRPEDAPVPSRGRRGDGRRLRDDRGLPSAGSSALARPKSRTFTVPSGRTLTLAGFKSRCTMLLSCAASSASAICLRYRRALRSSGTGPSAIRSASVGPSTSSITRHGCHPRCSRPWMVAMFG